MSLRQINFASTDLQLHARYEPQEGKTVFDSDIVKEVTAKTTVMLPLPEDRWVPPFFVLTPKARAHTTFQNGAYLFSDPEPVGRRAKLSWVGFNLLLSWEAGEMLHKYGPQASYKLPGCSRPHRCFMSA